MNIFKKIYNFIKKFFTTDFLKPESIVNYMFTAESLPEPLSLNDEISLVSAFQNDLPYP